MDVYNRKKQNSAEKENLLTKETLGVVLLLFATLCLVFLITGDKVFGEIGVAVSGFLYGVFGYFAYGVFIALAGLGVLYITEKEIGLSKRNEVLITVAMTGIAFILHVISMSNEYNSYGEYISASYEMGEKLSTSSAGGVFSSIITYPIIMLLSKVGSCVILGVVSALCIYAVVRDYVGGVSANKTPYSFNGSYSKPVEKVISEDGLEISGSKDYPVDGVNFNSANSQRLFVGGGAGFSYKSKKEISKQADNSGIKMNFGKNGLAVGNSGVSYSQGYSDEMQKKIEYIKTPAKINMEDQNHTSVNPKYAQENATKISEYIVPKREDKPSPAVIPLFEHDEIKNKPIEDKKPQVNKPELNDVEKRALNFNEKYADIEEPVEETDEDLKKENTLFGVEEVKEKEEKVEKKTEEKIEENIISKEDKEEIQSSSLIKDERARSILFGEEKNYQPKEIKKPDMNFTSRVIADGNAKAEVEDYQEEEKEEIPAKPQRPARIVYNRPPLDLLKTYESQTNGSLEDHDGRMEIIRQTLEDFHITAVPQSFVQGPSVTRYEIMMPAGISVKKVLNFDDDLRMRLASKHGVRIEAPIPGKNLVGVEVANVNKVTVGLKEVLEGSAGQKVRDGALIFAIGKDIVGKIITDDLSKGPHYLVAGATGSGKSVSLNAMIISLIMRYSPDDLRLILIDPKGVEFSPYEHIPHLMIDEIITEPKKALAAFTWAINEMERRYKVLKSCDTVIRDIDAYNAYIDDNTPKMPRVVMIVDELSNLMETCKKDMEAKILSIAQKARAVGIHLVLATQRPSVDVITGTIKANLPSRMALKVMNFADSNTILSEGGAEKLLGNGDMLYKNASMAECERYQGCWISDGEIASIVGYIKEHNEAYFDDDMKEFLDKETKVQKEETSSGGSSDEEDGEETNEFFLKALWLAVNTGSISISQLQRRYQIGYSRAGGLVDKMERMGYISGNEGSKARKVLLTKEEFEERYGEMPDAF